MYSTSTTSTANAGDYALLAAATVQLRVAHYCLESFCAEVQGIIDSAPWQADGIRAMNTSLANHKSAMAYEIDAVEYALEIVTGVPRS